MRDILFTGVTEGCADGQEALAGFTAQRLQVGTHISWQAQDFDQILAMSVACNMKAECLLSCVSDLAAEIECDAGYASHGQRLHFHIPAHTSSLRIQSICGDGELWIVSEGVLQAKLYAPDLTQELCVKEAEHVLQSSAICQLSWMGGCVLDGLRTLSQGKSAEKQKWQAAQESWLSHYVQNGTLHYQLPNGAPIENAFANIESTLPVACIAAGDPQHVICDYAIKMWDEHTQDDGLIADWSATAEGSYTVAYPMAVIAAGRDDAELKERALLQLRLRRERLVHEGDIYLRHKENHSFCSWARGIAWYMLGLSRTLTVLGKDSAPDLAQHLQERCEWIQSFQREDGLWNNFLHEEGFPPDTSGSAGIATALVLAYQLGLAPEAAIPIAQKTLAALQQHIQPDGFLSSVAPNNKRGEAEQHTHRRTIEPFALGLYAQLTAALNPY